MEMLHLRQKIAGTGVLVFGRLDSCGSLRLPLSNDFPNSHAANIPEYNGIIIMTLTLKGIYVVISLPPSLWLP